MSGRHTSAGDVASVAAAARRDGEAARKAERAKHTRYPGPALLAFVVEAYGRYGGEARRWLLSEVRELPVDVQQDELIRAHGAISCAVQGRVARQLRRAAGLKQPCDRLNDFKPFRFLLP